MKNKYFTAPQLPTKTYEQIFEEMEQENYYEDYAPRNGSNKPDTLLLVGTVAMIVMCGLIFISVVLMGY